jgi:carbamoyltransferase
MVKSLENVKDEGMYVLGISGLYHDASAALVRGDEIVAAAEEERFTRRKHDSAFPGNAIAYCLSELPAGRRVDAAAFYEDPALAFDRVLKSSISESPRGLDQWRRAASSMLGGKFKVAERVREAVGNDIPLFAVDHHRSHAASAFYPSPFDSAAILVVDGVGEWATTTIGVGHKNEIELLEEIRYPHSLGLLYSAFTYYCGFKVNSGEYKLMGLAPYGSPQHAGAIRDNLIDLRPDGSFALNTDFFDFLGGKTMINERFEALFGGPPRPFESRITQRDCDLAASVQVVVEDALLALATHARVLTGERDICMAGGVALNCVANGKIARQKDSSRTWIQPAASDAGGALGAALLISYEYFDARRSPEKASSDRQKGSLLGPSYGGAAEIEALDRAGVPYRVLQQDERQRVLAARIAEGAIVGYFAGRMEYGPRALGARSILADPRRADIQSLLNIKVKFRESWRPFAAAILAEDVNDYFIIGDDSPYMLLVGEVHPRLRMPVPDTSTENLIERLAHVRSQLPAITHVDYSTRLQTVSERDNPDFTGLLRAFKALTGCPLLVNTSLNVRGEPIVNTPDEAIACFLSTGIDVLSLGECVVEKRDVDPTLVRTGGLLAYD